ncbi:MAG: AraC family transcriptional regulator [Cyanobacteria bacterium P01_H01_bin.58]
MTSPQWISKQDPDWLAPGSPADPRLLHSGPDDRILLYPDGQGYRQEIVLQDDLSLAIVDYTLHQDVIVESRSDGDCLKVESQFTGLDREYSFLVVKSDSQDFWRIPAGRRSFEVEVILKSPALESYLLALIERLPASDQASINEALQYVYRGKSRDSGLSTAELFNRILQRPPIVRDCLTWEQLLPDSLKYDIMDFSHATRRLTTPAMKQVTAQILSCPYEGATRRNYLKEKALRLIALYLAEVGQSPLPNADLESIYQAAAILRRQMANPPTVDQLARQVCTNRLKLYEGFHVVYGTTPSIYLRNQRIGYARHLLKTSDWSVSEIAAAVGYTNRHRFATTFRQLTGFNPKAFQLQQQRYAS